MPSKSKCLENKRKTETGKRTNSNTRDYIVALVLKLGTQMLEVAASPVL
jgi:hypothetical protein